jgi:hypothetical protein
MVERLKREETARESQRQSQDRIQACGCNKPNRRQKGGEKIGSNNR